MAGRATEPRYFYRIYNIKKGLYSRGGVPVKWGKLGKVWGREEDLLRHFALLKKRKETDSYDENCVLEAIKDRPNHYIYFSEVDIWKWK